MRPISGYLALILAVAAIPLGIYINAVSKGNPAFVFLGVLLLIAGVFLIKGIMIVNPLLFAGHSESFLHAGDLFRPLGRTVYARADIKR